MLIRKRFESLLSPNSAMYVEKDRNDLERFVRDNHRGVGKAAKYIENDFSKYDKSQREMCMKIEFEVYKMIGMTPLDLETWEEGNRIAFILSYDTGIQFTVLWQRHSGGPTTSIGNTIVNIVTVAYSYRRLKFFFLGGISRRRFYYMCCSVYRLS
jgi:hypothetical protein